MRIGIFEQMTLNNGWILTLFILIITLLALGYGFGVKARRLPFTAEIGFNQKQWQFLRWWVKLALVAAVESALMFSFGKLCGGSPKASHD